MDKAVRGSSGGRGHMYAYGWFMLMYGRGHQNISNYPPINISKWVKKLNGQCNAGLCCSEIMKAACHLQSKKL